MDEQDFDKFHVLYTIMHRDIIQGKNLNDHLKDIETAIQNLKKNVQRTKGQENFWAKAMEKDLHELKNLAIDQLKFSPSK